MLLLRICIFLLLPLVANTQSFVRHACEAGEMDYTPGHGIELQPRLPGYELTLVVREKDWYDPAQLGRDGKDWLKAGGVSYLSLWRPGTWAKNHLSALVGFRMTENKTYEVCAYVNDREGGRRTEGITRVPVGETIIVTYRYREATETAEYTIKTDAGETVHTFSEFVVASRQLNVGPWHGGTSPAPVETGIWAVQRLLQPEEEEN